MFALPRGLSQLATSFFASQSQGIRPAPLLPDFNSQDRQPLETLTFDLVSPKPPIQLSKILKNKIQKLLIIAEAYLLLKLHHLFLLYLNLVEDSGVEPLTSCLQSRRSTS